jgi:uncharacterized membrane protein
LFAERILVHFVSRLRGAAAWFEIAWFVLWIFLMVKAYRGQKLKLPVIGSFADRHSGVSTAPL